MNKEQISSVQLGLMMYLMVGGTSILVVPSFTAMFAGQDMWISPILGSIFGVVNVWIAWRIHRMHPGKTWIQQVKSVFGRVLGNVICAIIIFFQIDAIGLITREYAEFIVQAFLSQTPLGMIIASIVLTCSFAVRSGVEVIGRFALIFGPIFFLFVLAIFLFLMPEYRFSNILPVFGKGINPALKGSLEPSLWFMEFWFISSFYPLVRKEDNGLKAGIFAVLFMMLTMALTNFTCLFMYGEATANLTFPFLSASRYINISDFFSHVEAIVMALWILGGFVQISMWYFTLVQSTSQWLKLKDYRLLVFPVGLLIGGFSIWVAKNFQQMLQFFPTGGAGYSICFLFLFPILLLMAAWIRRKIAS
ncbi:endospore germination permease [Paenibacillus donghaensis]|uniref:GerAB/ArcD/ProY family transporter n=1 Tax=Paenibacillus donghaensis TaxID=414771 RepID=UPI0018831965|nr:endospore germination permease [Paenibacillus donghaensis]MBE9914258.1 endospore germination permease [Paenibacillus donghaensis]